MPTIAIFFGIIVRMWHDDHPPAHIHAEYQGFEALIAIDTGEVVQGNLPRKVAAILKEWCATHRDELRDAVAARMVTRGDLHLLDEEHARNHAGALGQVPLVRRRDGMS